MSTVIKYCTDNDRFQRLLQEDKVFQSLRVSNYLLQYLKSVSIIGQGVNIRGSSKYGSITVDDTDLTAEKANKLVGKFGNIGTYQTKKMGLIVFSVFCNNTSTLFRALETLVKTIEAEGRETKIQVSFTTDIPNGKNRYVFCNDFVTFMSTLQLTKPSEQFGTVYLGDKMLASEYEVLLILACLNTTGALNIKLETKEIDRDLWLNRALETLAELGILPSDEVIKKIIL